MTMPVFIIIMVALFLAFVILMIMAFKPSSIEKKLSKNMGHMDGMMGSMMKNMLEVEKQILEENEEDLRNINKKSAEIESDGLEIKARAIKKGLVGDEGQTIFCRHCGQQIEADSKFCKYCGKEQ